MNHLDESDIKACRGARLLVTRIQNLLGPSVGLTVASVEPTDVLPSRAPFDDGLNFRLANDEKDTFRGQMDLPSPIRQRTQRSVVTAPIKPCCSPMPFVVFWTVVP